MVKNPERFEKIGSFSEGYAVAKLSNERYVIINEDGEITKKINRFGDKVDSNLDAYEILDNSLDNAVFRNGVIEFKDKYSQSNPVSRTTTVTTRTLNATKSGYTFVKGIEKESYGEAAEDFQTIKETKESRLLQEIYENPEMFFKLVPGKDFKSVQELRGFLDIVQHSMEQSTKYYDEKDKIKNAIKFADKVDKKFKKWQKTFANHRKVEMRDKIKMMGEE